jgi:hypothetical protein
MAKKATRKKPAKPAAKPPAVTSQAVVVATFTADGDFHLHSYGTGEAREFVSLLSGIAEERLNDAKAIHHRA